MKFELYNFQAYSGIFDYRFEGKNTFIVPVKDEEEPKFKGEKFQFIVYQEDNSNMVTDIYESQTFKKLQSFVRKDGYVLLAKDKKSMIVKQSNSIN